MSLRSSRSAQAGFTLLETLVALALLAIVLTTVFAVIGGGLRAAHRDEDRLLLGLVAQNLLVRSRLDLTTTEGARSGDIGGGLKWRIESEPYVPPEDILPPPPDPNADRGLAPSQGDKEATTDKTGESKSFGSQGSSFGDSRPDAQDRSTSNGAGSGSGFGDRSAGDAPRSGLGQRDEQQAKPMVRLRLIRVTVEKGGQQFELTGLATEPSRERTGAL